MATLKLILDSRRAKDDDTYPIKLSVAHIKSTFFVSTGIAVSKDQWNGKEVISHPKAKLYNGTLKLKHTQAENLILKLSNDGSLHNTTPKELKAAIENNNEEHSIPKPKTYFIEDHFIKYANQCNKPKTKELYLETLKKINDFDKQQAFDDIDVSWLKRFDKSMSETCGINTRALHMRNLRAVFNDAISEDLISQNIYPFRKKKFKIKKEKKFKYTLTLDEFRIFRDYPVQPHQEKYRDYCLLSFYLIGINLIDLANLKEIKNGRIEYKREKTGQLYSIEVLPEAMALIEKYKGINYLVNILDTHKNHKDFIARLNENIKKIGKLELVKNSAKDPKFVKTNKKKITPIFPKLEYYTFRRTWATFASDIDIPINTISNCLGHEIGSEITNLYINFDLKKVDKANQDVLNYVR